MTVKDLRELARQSNVAVRGAKKDLINRLLNISKSNS